MNKNKLQSALYSVGTGVLTAMLLVACSSIPEEDAASPEVIEEVLVTGSVIKGRGEDSSLPIEVSPAPTPAPAPPPAEPITQRERHEFTVKRQPIISRRVDPTMVFQHYGVNPTIDTEEENTSTFSIDVDTASYSISRAFLDRGRLPDPAAIRVEEFVNAFDYGYAPPAGERFALQAEVFPSPFRRGFHVLHLGVKGAEIDQINAKSNNLTFLIDVSGSMAGGQRLEMVKDALRQLVNQLKRNDTISIVAYTDNAFLVLEPTDVRYRRKIISAIDQLRPLNSTNVQAGLELAYQVANKSYHPDFNNRIILCSDGVANTGETNPKQMMDRISAAAQRGIYLNAIGVGMGNYNDVILETLAKQGQGQYGYINSPAEARHYFTDALIDSLQILARDVRLQVEFNTEAVASYRLLGYENRAMDNKDFLDARKDAGEVGAGHTVTAVYEIKLHPQYEAAADNFGEFRLAYKMPDSERLNTLAKALPNNIIASDMTQASGASRLSYLAAAFAEKLRYSYWSRTYDYSQLTTLTYQLRWNSPNKQQIEELHNYMIVAGRLDHRTDPYADRVSVREMSFDRVPVLQ